ncbi:MAG: hypothetical protein K6F77_04720 [Lachnospiraceae bacterium]|nr:hypothetical protein [Lachnospiraceae bacterium]
MCVKQQLKVTPAPTIITVKEGEEFKSLKVKKISSDSITLESEFTEYSCTIRKDGKFVKNTDDKKVFKGKVGETIDLTDISVLDASYSIGITVVNIE